MEQIKKYATETFIKDDTSLMNVLQKLQYSKLISEIDCYESGGILSLKVKHSDQADAIMHDVISNFDTYKDLQEEEYDINANSNEIDLCMIINDQIVLHGASMEVVRHIGEDNYGNEIVEFITALEKSNMDWYNDDDDDFDEYYDDYDAYWDDEDDDEEDSHGYVEESE